VLRVGTGFDFATRQKIWHDNMCRYDGGEWLPMTDGLDYGRKVTFKYQKHGMQDLPRFPVFKGFRED